MWIPVLLLSTLLVSGLISTLHAAPANDAGETTSGTREALNEVVEKLKSIEDWFSSSLEKRRNWQAEIKSTDLEISTVSKNIRELDSSLDEVAQSLNKLKAKQKQLENQKQKQAKLIVEHLSAAQRLSGQDFFKLLLNQESPDTFDRMIRYHSYFAEARSQVLAEFQTTLEAIEQNENTIVQRQSELETQQAQQNREKENLEKYRHEREAQLVGLSNQEQQKSSERDNLREDEKRLSALLDTLITRSQTLDGAAFKKAKGKLSWPLKGRVAHAFGRSRAGGRLKWQGIVIRAPQDTPIYAIHRGKVVFSNWLRGYGLLTIIDHGEGYMSVYAHADSLYKREGEWVDSGENIATAGRSGGQKDTGLYFELRASGHPQDPIAWLRPR